MIRPCFYAIVPCHIIIESSLLWVSHYWLVLFSRPLLSCPICSNRRFHHVASSTSVPYVTVLRPPSIAVRQTLACLEKSLWQRIRLVILFGLSALCSVTYFVRCVSRFSCLGSSGRRKTAKEDQVERGPLSADVYVDLASRKQERDIVDDGKQDAATMRRQGLAHTLQRSRPLA
jgi:hypothetical protein